MPGLAELLSWLVCQIRHPSVILTLAVVALTAPLGAAAGGQLSNTSQAPSTTAGSQLPGCTPLSASELCGYDPDRQVVGAFSSVSRAARLLRRSVI